MNSHILTNDKLQPHCYECGKRVTRAERQKETFIKVLLYYGNVATYRYHH